MTQYSETASPLFDPMWDKIRQTSSSSSSSSCICAFDIGGTKIAYGLFSCHSESQNILSYHPLYLHTQPSVRGIPALLSVIQSICHKVITLCQKKELSLLPHFYFATPGNYRNGTLLPGSARCLESYPGEFDHVHMAQLLSPLFPNRMSIHTHNDAVSQLNGAITLLHHQSPSLLPLRSTCCYIGPGTGLGGGFGDLNSLDFTPFTDGHIFDILLTPQLGPFKHLSIQAEDLFSGRAFFELTGHSVKDVVSSPSLFKQFSFHFEHFGHYLGLLIEAIYKGSIQKTDPGFAWPESHIQRVKHTSLYLLGGSIGSKNPPSQLIQTHAQKYLRGTSLPPIQIMSIAEPELAALIGVIKRGSSSS